MSTYSRKRKRRHTYAPFSQLAWSPAAIEEDDDIKLFRAQQLFNWMVRAVKRQIYRRPANPRPPSFVKTGAVK